MSRKHEYVTITTIVCDFCSQEVDEDDVFILPVWKTEDQRYATMCGHLTSEVDICRNCSGKPILEFIDMLRDKKYDVKKSRR